MIQLNSVVKKYGESLAVDNISLHIPRGEVHGIIGQSGAGKSTLLRLINLLEIPSSGEVVVNGEVLTRLTSKQLREARKKIGMIFQQFHLVGNKTVLGNVLAALQLARYPKRQQVSRAMECLAFVGLEDYRDRYPAELSGGQKQRVAIARALSTSPEVLLCDEPTSSLDPNTTAEILRVLEDVNKRLGVTIVLVSHEMDVVKSICTSVTVLDAGRVYQSMPTTPKGIPAVDNTAEYFVQQLGGNRHA
ncbi:methionine ABC transporter ATP-binding protein [Mangrovibacillus cuniculi]|uniref:ATP-binding cassette domain-containing protein n=1 Tax=Mangrovibacillus cuniculi TaxID=2593652 RepID=A0A7S8HGA0_9BACI|nr:ATP-binding cassette domain-containing protein [Mangrovibacillus cuniculi]QPC47587.1 ATP-binding cassette domain-containing protein [Mangrovibacillus cuniculi]